MANKEFEVLALDGHNFPTWMTDIKVSLSWCRLYACLSDLKTCTKSMTEKNKYEALYIIRNHIHPDLKSEYRMEENPRALWDNLKQQYEHQKVVVLPEASVGGRFLWFLPPTFLQNSWFEGQHKLNLIYINDFHKFCWIFECRNSVCKNWQKLGKSQASRPRPGRPAFPVWSLVSIFC